MTVKRVRELERYIEQLGLEVLQGGPANGHLRYLLRAPNNQQKTFTLPLHADDWRQVKNEQASLRRFHDENQANAVQAAFAKANYDLIDKAALPVEATQPVTKEAAMPQEEKRQPRNMLDTKQMFQLITWLSSSGITKDATSYTPIIEAAQKHFELPFTENNIKTAMEAADLKLEAALPGRTDRILVVATDLMRVMEKLGMEPSTALRVLVNRVAKP